MANDRVKEESFGRVTESPRLSKGTFDAMGNLANNQVIPDRGVSVNVKTGYPVKKS